ncbi:MAG: CoA transferase [Chelatococcus sp.]|nr:CoA transferase [Chelatococcus sp.]
MPPAASPRRDAVIGRQDRDCKGHRVEPLTGTKIVEMAGIGPAPFCGMLLADLGADVICVQRPNHADSEWNIPERYDLLNRNKRLVTVDLKSSKGVEAALELVEAADVLVEGYRPGVMEKLGLAPDICLSRNRRLVYARMTGWGQTGPLSQSAGHDLNYIAITGALGAIGSRNGPPAIPLNLVGDFGGGSLYLAMGVLAAVIEAQRSGKGQVIDAAMIDGVASLMAAFHGQLQAGLWNDERGSNLLDGGAPYYGVYETKDGLYVSIAAIETKFYREFLERAGLINEDLPAQTDRAGWDVLRARFTRLFLSRTRDEWCDLLEGTDCCFAPVLSLSESPLHRQNVARDVFAKVGGVLNPAPAPRFSRTPGKLRSMPGARSEIGAVLAEWNGKATRITG